MNKDLKLIKKYYGEEMMHYARENFSTILEIEGKLLELFLENFDSSKYLYEDLKKIDELPKFKNYIYNIFYNNKYSTEIETDKSPQELLDEVGYDLYECKTESDIQSFKKYYSKNEELCTFNGNRLDKCYVFFAVKKNVDEINRSDFKNPERQDEYGTSVISIQFSKDGTNSISIKNRYNHTVKDCDATFNNNLNNIILGLTESFEYYYGLKQKFLLQENFNGFIRANDSRYYAYNYCDFMGINYCQNNVLIENGVPKKLNKERYIILDTYVLDLQNKTFLNFKCINDCSINTIKNIKKIEVVKKDNNKLITIKNDNEDIIIEINKYGQIIGYVNNNIIEIDDNFMRENTTLEYLVLNNIKHIGDNFIFNKIKLKSFEFNNVESIGKNFLGFNNYPFIKKINLPKVKTIGNKFMASQIESIKELYMPNVVTIGSEFLCSLKGGLDEVNLPNLKSVDNYFLCDITEVKTVNLPKIESLKDDFLNNVQGNVSYFNISNCKIIEDNVLKHANLNLNNAHFDSLESIGDSFLMFSENQNDTLNMPNVKKIGNNVLIYEKNLKYINLPNLLSVGKNFLRVNEKIIILNIENLSSLGSNSLIFFIIEKIRRHRKLTQNELIIALKNKSKKLEKIQELRELKNKIIQSVYPKKKELKK